MEGTDWVDSLRNDIQAVETAAQLREFENKWATLTSYACGLHLHEGPWAGENWKDYVGSRDWD